MEITRAYSVGNPDTFNMKPVRELLSKYVPNAKVIVDPFARNSTLATFTNDLNPETSAQYHMNARDFLSMLKEQGVKADLILFDPPYSITQIKQCYDKYGLGFGQWEAQHVPAWTIEKDLMDDIITENGIVITFGWNSNGMGKGTRGFDIVEILLVAHGGPHHDTICTVEQKMRPTNREKQKTYDIFKDN